jgi:transcriptional regulator with XRE-family HTH domain
MDRNILGPKSKRLLIVCVLLYEAGGTVTGLDIATRRALGDHLRELRKQEGLTLAALSEQVGVSPSALSQFENGKAEPSLGTLWKLGDALHASLFDFFVRETAPLSQLTRAAERGVMVHGRARYESVTRSSQRQLDLFYLRLQPGEGPVRDSASHAGEEAGTVLSGRMRVVIGNEDFLLEPGDGIWLASDQPHTFVVVGDEECVSVWADTLPSQNTSNIRHPSRLAQEQL